jgi:hypothetical protein
MFPELWIMRIIAEPGSIYMRYFMQYVLPKITIITGVYNDPFATTPAITVTMEFENPPVMTQRSHDVAEPLLWCAVHLFRPRDARKELVWGLFYRLGYVRNSADLQAQARNSAAQRRRLGVPLTPVHGPGFAADQGTGVPRSWVNPEAPEKLRPLFHPERWHIDFVWL